MHIPTIDLYDEADREDWQRYVSDSRHAGIYHDLGWKDVVERAYGHKTFYLIARRTREVVGALPLVLTRSRIFGAALTSLPFVDFAGIAADDPVVGDALLRRATDLAEQLNVDRLELRQITPMSGKLQTSTHKVLMTMNLAASDDEAWSQLSSERRNRVRRALKSGLGVERVDGSKLTEFYDIWAKNMRDLGSPPHGRRFFEQVLSTFQNRSAILLVRGNGHCIGAAIVLYWKGVMTLPWVSSLRDHFRLYPNNILYWEAMRLGIENGIGIFDFGRSSRGSGTYEFKERWGAKPTTLYWQTLPFGDIGKEISSTPSATYQRAIRIWKRLPVAVTRLIGPALRRNITA